MDPFAFVAPVRKRQNKNASLHHLSLDSPNASSPSPFAFVVCLPPSVSVWPLLVPPYGELKRPSMSSRKVLTLAQLPYRATFEMDPRPGSSAVKNHRKNLRPVWCGLRKHNLWYAPLGMVGPCSKTTQAECRYGKTHSLQTIHVIYMYLSMICPS